MIWLIVCGSGAKGSSSEPFLTNPGTRAGKTPFQRPQSPTKSSSEAPRTQTTFSCAVGCRNKTDPAVKTIASSEPMCGWFTAEGNSTGLLPTCCQQALIIVTIRCCAINIKLSSYTCRALVKCIRRTNARCSRWLHKLYTSSSAADAAAELQASTHKHTMVPGTTGDHW